MPAPHTSTHECAQSTLYSSFDTTLSSSPSDDSPVDENNPKWAKGSSWKIWQTDAWSNESAFEEKEELIQQ